MKSWWKSSSDCTVFTCFLSPLPQWMEFPTEYQQSEHCKLNFKGAFPTSSTPGDKQAWKQVFLDQSFLIFCPSPMPTHYRSRESSNICQWVVSGNMPLFLIQGASNSFAAAEPDIENSNSARGTPFFLNQEQSDWDHRVQVLGQQPQHLKRMKKIKSHLSASLWNMFILWLFM